MYSIKKLIWENQHHFLDDVYLGCTQRQCEISKDIVDNYRTMFESQNFSGGEQKKLTILRKQYSYFFMVLWRWLVMQRSVWNDIVSYQTRRLNNSTKYLPPCIDDHHFKEEETKSVGELSHVCSQIVLKCLYLARIGRPDIPWSVKKVARSITKWTKAFDKRLNRLISYIHHTCPHDSLPDAGEAMDDFWSMSGNFIYRHPVEPRVKLYSPREESFPIPLKYIDVSRTTHDEFGCQAREAHWWSIGILMALETCLVLGQGSLNVLYWKKKLLTDIWGSGGD